MHPQNPECRTLLLQEKIRQVELLPFDGRASKNPAVKDFHPTPAGEVEVEEDELDDQMHTLNRSPPPRLFVVVAGRNERGGCFVVSAFNGKGVSQATWKLRETRQIGFVLRMPLSPDRLFVLVW
jgi:hypothetical protein